MSDDTLTTITFRLPIPLREKIKNQADIEERSVGAFIRFRLGQMFAMTEADTVVDDSDELQQERSGA